MVDIVLIGTFAKYLNNFFHNGKIARLSSQRPKFQSASYMLEGKNGKIAING